MIPASQPGQAAARAGEREELTGHRPIRPHRRCGAARRPAATPETGRQHVCLVGGQLADGSGIAAQHRPVDREIAEHLGDPEQVHVGRFERAGLLLREEPAARPVDPRPSPDPARTPPPHGQRRTSPGGASSPGTRPSSSPCSPDAPTRHPGQTPVRTQPPSQRPPITKARHHAEPRDRSPPGLCAALARQTGHKQARKARTAHNPALRIRIRALYAAVNVLRFGRPGLPLVTRPSFPGSAAWSASVIVTVSVVLSRPASVQKSHRSLMSHPSLTDRGALGRGGPQPRRVRPSNPLAFQPRRPLFP